MAWVKIDDHFDEHPKLAQIGPLGWGVWLAGLAYSNRNLTDGFIPHSVAESIGGRWRVWSHADDGRETVTQIARTEGMHGEDMDTDWVIELLLDAGAWERIEGGYRIHDYEQYQPTREDVLREREQTALRVRKWRESGGNGSCNAVTNTVSNAVGNGVGNGVGNSTPVPDPVPDPNPNKYISDSSSPHPEQPPEAAASGAVAESTTAAPTPDGDAVRRRKPATPVDAAVKRVMDAWNAEWTPIPWPKPKALTPKRRAHIMARLRNLSVDELCAAVGNMRASPHHTGDNERGWVADPEFLFRSDEQVERFLSPPQPAARASPRAFDPLAALKRLRAEDAEGGVVIDFRRG